MVAHPGPPSVYLIADFTDCHAVIPEILCDFNPGLAVDFAWVNRLTLLSALSMDISSPSGIVVGQSCWGRLREMIQNWDSMAGARIPRAFRRA